MTSVIAAEASFHATVPTALAPFMQPANVTSHTESVPREARLSVNAKSCELVPLTRAFEHSTEPVPESKLTLPVSWPLLSMVETDSVTKSLLPDHLLVSEPGAVLPELEQATAVAPNRTHGAMRVAHNVGASG